MHKYSVALLGIMVIFSAPYSSGTRRRTPQFIEMVTGGESEIRYRRPTGTSISGPQFGGFPHILSGLSPAIQKFSVFVVSFPRSRRATDCKSG